MYTVEAQLQGYHESYTLTGHWMNQPVHIVLQVLGKVFELIALLATESSKLSKKDAFTAITGLVDKMSDIKLKGSAGQALTAMSEASGPQFVFTQLHKRAAAQKNPKVGAGNQWLAAWSLSGWCQSGTLLFIFRSS